MAYPPSAQHTAASSTTTRGSVWIPVPEAMALCVEAMAPDAPTPTPAGRLWDRMSGAWLTRCRQRAA